MTRVRKKKEPTPDVSEWITVSLRIRREHLATIDAAARGDGTDRSNFMRVAALEKARTGVGGQP